MAEQKEPNKAPTQGVSISDTISELLQNPAQVDIATTLGLLDDPSTPMAGSGLDTSAMLDPSTFLQPPSSVVSSTAHSSTQKSVTSSSSPSKSLEAISSRLLQSISASSEKEEGASLAQKSQHFLASGSAATVDDSSKKVPSPTASDSTVADLTSIIDSIVSQEQQAVAAALTSSAPPQPLSTTTTTTTTMTSGPGSIPNPIPIPSVTHIPHSASTSTPAQQDMTVQKRSTSGQKGSILHMSMAIPSLGDLCKSLGVNISSTCSKETPPLQASAPTPAISLSTPVATTNTSTASVPSTAAVGKTEREPNAPVTDQSIAPKLQSVHVHVDRDVVSGTIQQKVASSEHKRVVSDAGSLQQKQPSPVSSTVQQHDSKQPLTEVLSVNRGTTEPASSEDGVSDKAKNLESADSVGKAAVIPSSFLSAIKLQPASSVQNSLPEAASSSQLQASAALPQNLPSSSSSTTSLATSTLPASTAGSSSLVKNAPLHVQTKIASGSSSVQASISQPQSTQKAVQSSLSTQTQSTVGGDTATKVISAATCTTTPALTTPAVAKATISRQMPATTTTPAAKTVTPPIATPTTTGAGIKIQQQTTGKGVQVQKNSSPATTTTTTPKADINIPILQFLQANFPALQLGALATAAGGAGSGAGKRGGGADSSSKDVLQVQTLLAHVLQQQQQLQQLQQQAQQQVQKAIASGQPLAACGNSELFLVIVQ